MQHDIWLVEPSKLFREGLKMLLIKSPFQVTWEGAHMSLIDEGSCPIGKYPAVILIALHALPETGGEDASQIDRICQLFPGAAVVVISDTFCYDHFVAVMTAGAHAYLLRDIEPEGLKQSLMLALTGEKVLPTSLAQMVIDGLQSGASDKVEPKSRNELSTCERLILKCVTNGYPNKVIANRLNIAEATVKSHMKSVFRKIKVRNRTEAAVWALSHEYRAEPPSHSHPLALNGRHPDRDRLLFAHAQA